MGEISGISTADLNNVDGFFTTQGGGSTVTPTPQTASIEPIQYSDGTLTIANSSSYSLSVGIYCDIKSGSNIVTPNSSMSYDASIGKLTWVDGGTEGTRTFFLSASEFGTGTVYTPSPTISGSYTRGDNARKYWRYQLHGTTSHTYTRNLRFFTELSQTGTSYPPDMTSNTAPTPYIASASYSFSVTYAPFKAFDNNAGSGWWNLGAHPNQYNDFCQVYLGTTPIAISSADVIINPTYAGVNSISIIGANDTNFTTDVLILVSSQSKSVSTAELKITI
tara:strand:- start:264 stop:1097 length:834 start_codon:yes stop_codon:yes gene_type:complete